MLTSEAKQRIDGARQVLVGVLPNPMQQVEQITIALIYKFMDDMDEEARKLPNGKGSFFVGELKKYSWHELMDTRLTNQDKLNLYREATTKISESKKIPELFRSIFRNTHLPFNDPRILGLFLSEINQFDYDNSEELGNAYEYLLSIMGSQGDAGQFRTPRHIIDFIVKAIDPKKNDRILDPACGTAGFLISAYKHILETHDGIDNKTGKPARKETPLTSAERSRIHKNITGYDIDPNMVKTAKVNTYLHKFKDPDIKVYDTISKMEYWDKEFDVILANPPFMTPKGGIEPHSKFRSKANRAEVLFVDYILEHLSVRGRAGIIVPEGIIFQSANAYKALREDLVEDGLYAVVSLPSGVFNPYSGVKTSILLFDKDITKKNKEILFVKIEKDGFDLGAQRRETPDKNDLPQALEILKAWKEKQTVKKGQKLAFAVSKSEIAESGDYNLTGERYREVVDYSNVEYEMEELDSILDFHGKGGRPASFKTENGKIPFMASSVNESKCDSADFDFEAIIIGDGGSANVHYKNVPFSASDHTYILKARKERKDVNIEYVYKVLVNNLDLIEVGFKGQGLKNVAKAHLKQIKIPLPPLEVQKQIVEELDGYQKIIDGAKQVVENWKPTIKIDPDWEIKKINEIAELEYGIGESAKESGEYRYIRITDINDRGLLKNENKKYIKKTDESKKYKLEKGDLLIARTGATYGKTLYFDSDEPSAFAGFLIRINFKQDIVKSKFFWNFAQSEQYWEQAKGLVSGGGQPQFNAKAVGQVKIPLPPLEIQEKIVAEIEAEQEMVNQNKKLIEIFEQKIKTKISEIWGE